MMEITSISHATTVEIDAHWERAFEYLSDPSKLGDWSLGCREPKRQDEQGLFQGTSLFGGGPVNVKIDCNKHFRVIDYWVGDLPDLGARISARVLPGPHYGKSDDTCLVTLSAWRDVNMADQRWRQLVGCHEAEIMLIKALVEGE